MSVADFATLTRKQKLLAILRVVGLLLGVGICCALAGFLLMTGILSGSKVRLAASMVFALLPVLLYFAATRPFIFPFALFVFAIPVDNLLGVNSLLSHAAANPSQHVATLTKFMGLASGLAFVLWLMRNRRYVSPPTAAILWFSLLIWMGLSYFWALESQPAIDWLVTYAELIVLMFAVSIMPITLVELQVFVSAVVLGGLVTSSMSIYQFRVGGTLHASLNQIMTANPNVRAAQAAIDPNQLTAVLLLPIAIVLAAFLQRRWSLSKLALGGILAVFLGAVYVVASRGGIVGLAALLGYFMWRSRYRAQVVILSLAALVASLAHGMSSGTLWGRFVEAAKEGGSGRVWVWKVGLYAFKHHLLLGAGVGNFPIAYNRSYLHIFELINMGWNRVSHNTPLGLAVELGLVGLIVAALAAYFQFRMLSFIGKSDPLYDFRIGLEAGFVGLLVASLFLWVMPGKYPWLLFELMAATRTFALCRPAMQPAPSTGVPIDLSGGDVYHHGEVRVPLGV